MLRIRNHMTIPASKQARTVKTPKSASVIKKPKNVLDRARGAWRRARVTLVALLRISNNKAQQHDGHRGRGAAAGSR